MNLPWRHKVRRKGAIEEARRERIHSEQRLAETTPVVISLHDMAAENHIRPLLRRLIQGQDKPKEWL